MKSEKIIQNEILAYLKSIGAYSIKTVVSNRKGIPDIICSLEGQFVAIEVKSEVKGIRSLTPLQKYELTRILSAGGFTMCANSLDYVKQIFEYYLMEL